MPQPLPDSDATRASLVGRLRDLEDQVSWQEFFDIYSGLVYGVARRANLTASEADDVVQETFAGAARHLPGFCYDPARGSFKAWLLQQTRWRIADAFRRRLPVVDPQQHEDETQTSPIERLADPRSLDPGAVWETDYKQALIAAATKRVKRHINPEDYQIFDLYVNKGWPAERVAEAFGVTVNRVYIARTRIVDLIEAEVKRLEKDGI